MALSKFMVFALALAISFPLCMAELTPIPGGYDPGWDIGPARPSEFFTIPPNGGSTSFVFKSLDLEVTIKGAENQTEDVRGEFSAIKYLGNPMARASLPSDFKAATFVLVSCFGVSDSDIAPNGIKMSFSYDPEKVGSPRQILRYDPEKGVYSPLQTVDDSQAKTLTAIISTTQGLYAIGGSEPSQLIWVAAVVSVIVAVVVAAMFLIIRKKGHLKPSTNWGIKALQILSYHQNI